MKQSVFYLKKLTSAEVGTTKAHVGGYIRLPNDFDYELFFQSQGIDSNGVTEIIFNAYNRNTGVIERNLRFAYFGNSNKERRIPNLATLYKENHVEEGDIVKLESRINDGAVQIYIQFFKNSDVKTSASNIFYVCDDAVGGDLVYDSKIKKPLQQIFYGAPGTGKSNTIKREVDERGKVCYRTTFHPDSDYSTFVGCYKPSMKPTGVTLASGEKEEVIAYKFVPQAFTKAYVEAWNTTEDVFLVIEEINRGNCAQIFGDLFQLLDRNDKGFSEYPIDADSDLADYLAEKLKDSGRNDIPENVQNGKKLLLPSNLFIWATMNTSDQSLFPIDSAFKRRWEWKYIPITDHRDMEFRIDVDGTKYDWGTFMRKINEVINSVTSSEDKKLGYFFAKANEGVINADLFVGKVLFYLWNDVFKNYGFDNEIFQKEDGTKIAFSEFFNTDGSSNANMVKLFMKNLDVDIVEDAIVEEDEDGNTPSTPGKNYDKYSVNGNGRYGKNRLATECVREYVRLHPEQRVDEVLNIWRNIGMIVPHFIESKEEYDARIDNSKRSYDISCGDSVIYVAHNGYGSNGKVQELIEAVNSRDLGITLAKVE